MRIFIAGGMFTYGYPIDLESEAERKHIMGFISTMLERYGVLKVVLFENLIAEHLWSHNGILNPNLFSFENLYPEIDYICEHPLCSVKIEKKDWYIIESTSSGKNKAWHLHCYDLFINSIQDSTRPFEIKKIKEDYWFTNRKDMIKVRN